MRPFSQVPDTVSHIETIYGLLLVKLETALRRLLMELHGLVVVKLFLLMDTVSHMQTIYGLLLVEVETALQFLTTELSGRGVVKLFLLIMDMEFHGRVLSGWL